MVKILATDDGLVGALPVVGSTAYLRAKSSRYGWFRDDDLVLPFIIERRAIFDRLVFTHQTICLSGVCPESREKEFLNRVVSAAHQLDLDFIYQPQATAVFRTVPDGVVYSQFGTYVVDLELSENRLWDNVHGKHRNVIKKAKDMGVEISEGAHNLEICFDLIYSTMKRNHKLSVSRDELERFNVNLAENVSFYVAKKDDVAQGAAVIVWNKGHNAYYLYGGTSDSPSGGAMNLLHWQAMIDMKGQGVRQYDFVGARVRPPEGSKLETIQRFKARFGATMRQGYLWKYPLKPLRYAAFQLFARANSMMHGAAYKGDIIDEEQTFG